MEFRRAGHVAWRVVAGETVLIDLRRNVVLGLSPRAGTLWRGLDRAATADLLVELWPLGNAACDDTPVSSAEVTALLRELEGHGLVDVVQVGQESLVASAGEADTARTTGTPLSGPETIREAVAAPVPRAVSWSQDISSFGACGLYPVGGPTPCANAIFPS